jgi:hypothetical protein
VGMDHALQVLRKVVQVGGSWWIVKMVARVNVDAGSRGSHFLDS